MRVQPSSDEINHRARTEYERLTSKARHVDAKSYPTVPSNVKPILDGDVARDGIYSCFQTMIKEEREDKFDREKFKHLMTLVKRAPSKGIDITTFPEEYRRFTARHGYCF